MSDVTIVELPKLYENMDEATIGPWQVQLGQRVAAGDVLVELITDKTVVEFEAPVAGVVLKIYGIEKSTVPHGYALCAIGEDGASAPDLSVENEAKVAAHLRANAAEGAIDVTSLMGAASSNTESKPSYRAAPAAKAFARAQNVDLAAVAAFCGRDMIHRKDVEDYLASKKDASPAAEAVATSSTPAVVQAAAAESSVELNPSVRVALVTGATGGIGQAIVRRLAAEGIAVAIHYHNDGNAAEALCSEIRGNGGVAEKFLADLGAPGASQALATAVEQKFGRIDILVNNAGCLADGMVAFTSDEQWSKVLNLCLTVPFELIRACSMGMAHRRWGRIVNMSSDAGRMGSANRSNYSSAKEGLCGLTRSVALELAGMGVRVNAVSPGFIDSPMTTVIPETRRREIIKSIPVHRFGKPQDVAEIVAFLCSDKADYITGQVISVNGGLCM